MKINAIRIRNFRGIKEVNLEGLSDKVVLVGHTGQGKSTILDAIRMVLVGDIQDATGKRVVNADLLSAGMEGVAASISIDFDNGITADLTIEPTGKQALRFFKGTTTMFPSQKTMKDKRTAFWTMCLQDSPVPLDERHVACAASPRNYLLGEELGVLLAELVGGDFTRADVLEYAGEEAEWLGPYMHDVQPRDLDINELGAVFEEEAKQTRKTIRAIEVDLEKVKDAAPIEVKGKMYSEQDIPAFEIQMEALRQQRVAKETLLRQAEMREAEMNELPRLKEDLAALETDYATASDEYEAHTKEYEKAFGVKEKAGEALRDLDGELKAVSSKMAGYGSTECPTCGREYENAEELRVKLENATQEYNEKKAVYDEQMAKYEELDAACLEAYALKTEAREKQHNIARDMERAEASVNALEKSEAEESAESYREGIHTIDERIVKGRAILVPLQTLKQKRELEGELDRAKALLTQMVWGVETFRDGAFVKSRLGEGKALWEARCNERLEKYGYALEVRVEGKNATVWLIRKETGVAVPVPQASRGEQQLAEWAVATAWLPQSPVLIDNSEAISSRHKAAFMADVRDIDATVIVSGAWALPGGAEAAGTLKNYMRDATVVWVEKGKAELVNG